MSNQPTSPPPDGAAKGAPDAKLTAQVDEATKAVDQLDDKLKPTATLAPIDEATRKIIGALMTEGRFRRAYLGIAGGSRPLPPRVSRRLGRDSGVEVVQVAEGSPAAEAGLRPEDLIVELDGEPVADVADIQRLMVVEKIGAPVPLLVLREGRELGLSLVPAELS